MALNTQGYFNGLTAYLNTNHYGVNLSASNEILLKEKVFGQHGVEPIEYTVRLRTTGEILFLKLDIKKNGSTAPLFHFLDDTAKPWSKRCDFVIFNLRRQTIYAYCMEFKSESIPRDVPEQLKASVNWLKSLQSTIRAYTAERCRIKASKYILSDCRNLEPYLDGTGKYLKRDHTIRHYLYSEMNGMALADLENSNIEEIR